MPKPPRFFISPDQVVEPRITVSGEDVRHIRAVLRMKTGDELLLCDGRGTEYTAKITGMDRSAINAEITSRSKKDIQYPRVTLGQGLPKSDKMDWIVQKATELGVADIVPIITERTIVKVKDGEKRKARWQKIAREAAMQSNRADIPRVGAIRSLQDFILSRDPEPLTPDPSVLPLKLLPWEEAVEPIKGVLRQNPGAKNIIVLIGPEGGFSKDEAGMAKGKGFAPVSIGPNILRTETAALAVLSMIGYEYR
jgi:16S rRNA (uracil1498-N3)-methyltransferase